MRKFFTVFGIACTLPALAAAQDAPVGAPPPEAKALVAAPTATGTVPTKSDPTRSTTAALSAGGMLTGGNTKAQALTINGMLDLRRGANGFGASILGNYGEAGQRGEQTKATAENVQLRLRYDRYLIDKLSLFLIATERYDKFQGIASRTNLDPGVKYIFWMPETSAFWGELGYDFQYDIRTRDGRTPKNADGLPTGDPLLSKTLTDHSARAYLGFRHAFNKEVTLSLGAEYLQSLVETDRGGRNARMNFDGTLAAKVYGGLAVGIGGTVRHDRNPLPGKAKTDLGMTLSLIYAFSDVADASAATAAVETAPCPTAPDAPADPTAPQSSTGTVESGPRPAPNTAPTPAGDETLR